MPCGNILVGQSSSDVKHYYGTLPMNTAYTEFTYHYYDVYEKVMLANK